MKKYIAVLFLILWVLMCGNAHAEWKNFIYGTLAAELADDNTTSFDISPGANSATWPTSSFLVVVYDAACSAPSSCAHKEIISITSRTSNTLTIGARDQEGTTHSTYHFPLGSNIIHILTAATITALDARGVVESEAFASAWNGDTTNSASKNDLYDYAHTFDTDDDGKVNVLDSTAGMIKTDANGVVSVATANTDYLAVNTAAANITPTTQADCSTVTALGRRCCDTDDNLCYVGNGTAATLEGTSVLTTTISNSDTSHAPDGNSVFDALAAKVDGTIWVNTMAGAPGATDDSGDGYAVGDGVINTTTGCLYIATDVTLNAAVWVNQCRPPLTTNYILVGDANGYAAPTNTLPTVTFSNGATGGGYIRLLEDTDNGTDYVQVKGSDDSGTTPTITFSGSPANTEDFSIALGANNNTITMSSSTGATELSISALNLATTGTIQGAVKINSDANGMTSGEMTTAGMYGSMFLATGAGTWNLPAAAAGMAFCIYSTTAAAVVVNPDNSDVITLNGTALAAGDSVTSASGAGDFICLVAGDTTNWYSMGRSGIWTDTN